MRLAILGTRGIPARYGGFETFAQELAVRLIKADIEVTVFCPGDSRRNDETYLGITLKYIESSSVGMFSELFWDVRCLWIARSGFDIVYMLGVGAGFAAWIPRLFGSVVWINPDGLEWKRTKWSLWQRAYLALMETLSVLFASRIIADSGAIADYLCRRYPGLKKMSMIAYGANIPAKKPSEKLIEEWNLSADSYYLVVCRLEPENHLLEIIEGFAKGNSLFPLVVLGRIEEPNAYVKKLLAYQSDRIRFVGTVYDSERITAIRFYARAYVHGHSVGGTNPSLLEAMACSNLVIAHDNPFNREVLADLGLYFSKSDELTSMVEAVDAGRVDRSTRQQKLEGVAGSRYSWDDIANSYLELIKVQTKLKSNVESNETDSFFISPRS
jgi:glycosyltransferase involved in cell wall biosynthesis